MLEEALQFLSRQACESQGSYLSDLTDNGDGTFLVVNRQSGTAKIVDAEAPLFGTVASIGDMGVVAAENSTDGESIVGVFVSKDKAVLQLGDNLRAKNRFTLPLRVNPVVEILRTRCQSLSHKACMRLLRVELASVELDPFDFKGQMSSLKFESTSTTETTVKKGDESIGKSIRAKVTNESEIPEELSISFSVYPDVIDNQNRVRCSVIVDTMEQLIHIIPLPGELEGVLLDAQSVIASLIREELSDRNVKCPVICGTFCE